MFDVILQRVGKVFVDIGGAVLFVVVLILLPFAFTFMWILEGTIKALDNILSGLTEFKR